MLTLLKLIQSIIKTLHSDGTPGQVAVGIALGSVLGLTPLMNLHNLLVFSLIEYFGYRQLFLIWRVVASWNFFFGRIRWRTSARTGFVTKAH